jgi:hypothetical protein
MKRWLALLLLAGCGSTQWEKPGATQDMADADARACAAAAQTAPSLPRSQTTLTSSGAAITTEPTQPVDARRQMEQGERMQDCMRQKGYQLRGS